jgi:hypothetical protein
LHVYDQSPNRNKYKESKRETNKLQHEVASAAPPSSSVAHVKKRRTKAKRYVIPNALDSRMLQIEGDEVASDV